MHGDTALMVHGAGGGGWEWALWARVFAAAGWRVHAPDLLPAPGGLAGTRLADYDAQVLAWCSAPQPRLLIGASLGGLLALRAAAHLGEALLVLVNPLPPAGIDGAFEVARRREGDIVRWQRDATLHSTARALPDAEPDVWQVAWRRWRDESGAVLTDAASARSDRPQSRSLVLVSGADDDVPAASSRAVARWLGAELLEFPEASHVGPLLGRDAIDAAERVLAWVQFRS